MKNKNLKKWSEEVDWLLLLFFAGPLARVADRVSIEFPFRHFEFKSSL